MMRNWIKYFTLLLSLSFATPSTLVKAAGQDAVADYLITNAGGDPANPPPVLKDAKMGMDPKQVPQTPNATSTHPHGATDRAFKAKEASELSISGKNAAKTAAKLMLAQSVALVTSSNPIEQRAGDILFKNYVDTYGAPQEGMLDQEVKQMGADQEAATQNWAQHRLLTGDFGQLRQDRGNAAANQANKALLNQNGGASSNGGSNAPFPAEVESLLANAGVDVGSLQDKAARRDWEGVQQSLREARDAKSMDDEDQETASQKIADALRNSIVNVSHEKTYEGNSTEVDEESPYSPDSSGESIQSGEVAEEWNAGAEGTSRSRNSRVKRRRLVATQENPAVALGQQMREGSRSLYSGPRGVTMEQLERAARRDEDAEAPDPQTPSTESELINLDGLHNVGIQKLGRGISIFRYAHHRISRSTLKRPLN